MKKAAFLLINAAALIVVCGHSLAQTIDARCTHASFYNSHRHTGEACSNIHPQSFTPDGKWIGARGYESNSSPRIYNDPNYRNPRRENEDQQQYNRYIFEQPSPTNTTVCIREGNTSRVNLTGPVTIWGSTWQVNTASDSYRDVDGCIRQRSYF